MHSKSRFIFASLAFTSLFITSTVWGQPQVLVTGLQGPQKIILTPQGNLLVSEPSVNANSGRISFVTRGGARNTLLEGLPSGTEVTLAGGSGPSAMALRERTLYFALGAGDGERRGQTPGTSIHNPEGSSSPLFASILEVRFNLDVDAISGPFTMTTAHQRTITDGGEVEIADNNGGTARISMLARFPISEPAPNRIYRFSNPWGMALTENGGTLWVTDASIDALVRVDTATGRWRRVTRFPPQPNPGTVGPPMLDVVPTSVRTYGEDLLVSFLTGFPFVPGYARVLGVDPETGATEPFINWLTSVTDFLWRPRPSGRPQFFVLEFSQNQSAQPPAPGRLLSYDSPDPQVVLPVLITPVSLAYDPATQDLFILELRGQILRLHLD